MGQEVKAEREPEAIRAFTRAILQDLHALERILADGLIESDVRRIGVEQELFLVDRSRAPAPRAMEVLERLKKDSSFTTELAKFNLEINLEPLRLERDCFRVLEGAVRSKVEAARAAAKAEDADVLLAGILPTLNKSDLSLDNITPRQRYYALNEAVNRMRGGPGRLRIQGIDELDVEYNSVMYESCNTSFQVHLQAGAEEFAHMYNAAQAVSGPVLASMVNSPLLFGRRLWAETRIALFQQSVDTRGAMPHLRERSPRVRFGEHWVNGSVLELFQEDLSRFWVLLSADVEEDPFARLEAGEIPLLRALQLHNGTVYRWNRPCYGISDGRPHLRIECRYMPSGPTIVDETANAAFWAGSVLGLAQTYRNIPELIEFDEVKGNFLAAARHGPSAAFSWLDGETVGAKELILERLLPIAREGLQAASIDDADIDHYLGIIETRVATGQTGSQWLSRSLGGFKDEGTRGERLAALTGAMVERQKDGRPGHEWPLARLGEAGGWQDKYLRVEDYMTTDLFTVHEDELVDLVAFLMDQKHIRHVLVEDDSHRIVGLVSYRSLLRLLIRGRASESDTVPVGEVMVRDPITIPPETSTIEAIELMRDNRVSCLPVVKDGKLIGMVSERDFLPMARQLLEERLKTRDT
ncbi:MAG: CBS domain-containing protein [Gemmatimonadota bacterium]|nr:CBS domain-containing protein [Candidatus Palauibacterales bacterium]